MTIRAHHVYTSERDMPPVASRPGIACRPDDNAYFYPEGGVDETAKALALCRRCPHRRDCLIWALKTKQRFGTWGGLTANQRTRILTRLAAIKSTTPTAS